MSDAALPRRPIAAARRRARRLTPALALPLAVLLGLALRLAPCVREPGFEFVVDASYHARLTGEVVASGRLPGVDRLSEAPAGRDVAGHLPTGLYRLGALFHHLLSGAGSRDLRWNLACLIALAGALIAVPVWIGAWAASGRPAAASLAALVSVFLPAHLQRSAGFYYRYDAPGTLLVSLHAALALAALAEPRSGRRRAWAAGSAVALVAAVGLWRVSLLILALALAGSLVRLAWRGAEPALRDLWLAIAVIGTPAMALIPYLQRQGFLHSPLWVGAVGLALVLSLPALGPGGRRRHRIAAVAALVTVMAGASRFGGATDYASLPVLLATRLGLLHGHDPVAAMMLDVQELRGVRLQDLLADHRQLFLLGPWLLASPWIAWWLAGRPAPSRLAALDAAPAALAFLTAGLLGATLLFERTYVVLAPFAAMALGAVGAMAYRPTPGTSRTATADPPVAPARRGSEARSRRRPPGPAIPSATARGWLVAALATCAVATMGAGILESFTSWSRLDRDERAAIRFLRDHGSRGAIVACDWDAGYDVQSGTGLATVVDGFLESAENRRRIGELYAAFLDPAPEALMRFCVRYGARWLLVPPGSAIYYMAAVVGDPLAGVLARHEPVRPGPLTDHVVVHLVAGDVAYPAFRVAFQSGGFQVFEVVMPAGSGIPLVTR